MIFFMHGSRRITQLEVSNNCHRTILTKFFLFIMRSDFLLDFDFGVEEFEEIAVQSSA